MFPHIFIYFYYNIGFTRFKLRISRLPTQITLLEAKAMLINDIKTFITERITLASDVIATYGNTYYYILISRHIYNYLRDYFFNIFILNIYDLYLFC